ncbi:cysteine rich repeat-containing protein [Ensifer adhaerens]|nr:cysteine rich repeat-containing protein [Ensifer adhaerens]MBZ7926221.1 cysteine rich repeat-containing protein [Ensifer adhaerens]
MCKGLNLGNGRIADCLQQNASKVTPTYRGAISVVLQSIAQREQAQASYQKVCQRDIAKRCSDIKGDGFILACLATKQERISQECNQVITEAGWRQYHEVSRKRRRFACRNRSLPLPDVCPGGFSTADHHRAQKG